MNAIPTIGPKGIQFRSRLEAQWAYIFEIFKWSWEYEPIDLNGYIPDFILKFGNQEILVEVKGELDIWNGKYKQYIDKIERSGWEKEFIILGANYRKDDYYIRGVHVGVYDTMHENTPSAMDTADNTMLFRFSSDGIWFIGCNDGGWLITPNDIDDDRNHKNCVENVYDIFETIWVQAKNCVQWNGLQNGNLDISKLQNKLNIKSLKEFYSNKLHLINDDEYCFKLYWKHSSFNDYCIKFVDIRKIIYDIICEEINKSLLSNNNIRRSELLKEFSEMLINDNKSLKEYIKNLNDEEFIKICKNRQWSVKKKIYDTIKYINGFYEAEEIKQKIDQYRNNYINNYNEYIS